VIKIKGMHMNFKIILTAFLIIFSFYYQANAVEVKPKYPPYPDVWGYDISDDVDIYSAASSYIEKRANGDYTIFYYDKNGIGYNIINTFEREKKKFYELSPIGITTRCKEGKECVNEVYFLASSFIKLEDDTFFTFDTSHYLFIRFDRDFKTKFKPQHTVKLEGGRELKGNFYVLPYSKIKYFLENIATWYTGEYNDEVNRRLDRQFLDWLYEEEQKGDV